MLSRDEQVSRRVARMEALVSDLGQIGDGYQPTDLEKTKAEDLGKALGRFFLQGVKGDPNIKEEMAPATEKSGGK